ncbi:MAG: hypothetical protein K0S14_1600 [Thermomicrobiales bacterium]|nr:hypothetical protein [Thermomicrobiales bacterium]
MKKLLVALAFLVLYPIAMLLVGPLGTQPTATLPITPLLPTAWLSSNCERGRTGGFVQLRLPLSRR